MASIFDNLVAAGIGSAGSLLGLPELGTSERYLNNRSGGGFVSPVASNQGSVLGASNTQQASNEFIGPTRPIGPLGPPSGYVAPSNNQQSSGGSGGSGNPESSNQEDIARDAESKLRKEADSIFGDAKRAADKSRGRAQGNYDSLLSDIGSIFGQQRESAATGAQQSARDLDAREQEAQRGKEDIIAQARQILQESGIGAGQRFGADSDIARALGEYANVGFQKAKTSAHNTFQQAKTQIMNQKMKIQEDYMNFIKNIDIQETTQKNDAYRSFQNVLNQIDSMVDQAGSERSNLRIQAIQQLKDDMMNISMNNQSLKAQAQQEASGLSQHLESLLGEQFGVANAIGQDTAAGYDQVDTGGYEIENAQTNQDQSQFQYRDEERNNPLFDYLEKAKDVFSNFQMPTPRA